MKAPPPHRIDAANHLAAPALDRRNPPSSAAGLGNRHPQSPRASGNATHADGQSQHHEVIDRDAMFEADASLDLADQLLDRHATDLVQRLQQWGAELDGREAQLTARAAEVQFAKRELQRLRYSTADGVAT
ncbi:MAG: hypothetical protein AAF958_02545 [Planctomycetota bacterium]